MAKLQLRLDIHGITDGEFVAFCDATERDAWAPGTAERKRAGHARPRRDGELRLMRRAWRRPERATVVRGTKRRAGQ
jgi:hypothetical protein